MARMMPEETPDTTPEYLYFTMHDGSVKVARNAGKHFADAQLRDCALQHSAQKLTPAQVYERWHRARGQNKKITLRQVCELLDVNYDSVRAARSRAKRKKRK